MWVLHNDVHDLVASLIIIATRSRFARSNSDTAELKCKEPGGHLPSRLLRSAAIDVEA